MHRIATALLLAVLALVPACLDFGGDEPGAERLVSQGNDAYATGLYIEARGYYEEYLKEKPQGELRWQAWDRLLDISKDVMGDYPRALAIIEAMLLEYATDPVRSAGLQLAAGDIYRRMGDSDKAFAAWQKCLEMDGAPRPIAWTAALKLSKGYRLQGRYGMAQETYKACLANAPDPVARARCMYEMALTASFIENWELVEQLLTEVIETRGLPAEDKSVAAFLLADSWISQERIPEAVALLTEIKDDYPNPMAVEARLGQLEK